MRLKVYSYKKDKDGNKVIIIDARQINSDMTKFNISEDNIAHASIIVEENNNEGILYLDIKSSLR